MYVNWAVGSVGCIQRAILAEQFFLRVSFFFSFSADQLAGLGFSSGFSLVCFPFSDSSKSSLMESIKSLKKRYWTNPRTLYNLKTWRHHVIWTKENFALPSPVRADDSFGRLDFFWREFARNFSGTFCSKFLEN